MEKNKIKFIFIAIIALVAISTSVFYFDFLKLPEEKTAPVAEEKKFDPQKQLGEIIKTKDFNKCGEIEDEIYKAACVNNIASNFADETDDVSYCKRLDDSLMSVGLCEFKILSKKAEEEKKSEYCGQISEEIFKNRCLELFWAKRSLEEKNIGLCGNLKTEEAKNYCSDSYLIDSELIKNPSGFNCDRIKSDQSKIFCENYKRQNEQNKR